MESLSLALLHIMKESSIANDSLANEIHTHSPGKTNHQYQFSGKEMAWGKGIREGGNDIENGRLRMERTQPI